MNIMMFSMLDYTARSPAPMPKYSL